MDIPGCVGYEGRSVIVGDNNLIPHFVDTETASPFLYEAQGFASV